VASKQALILQKTFPMKRLTVAILAVLSVVGCGAGIDDPEGNTAAFGAMRQGLVSADGQSNDRPLGPGVVEVFGTAGTFGGGADPSLALPQDPIPMFDARTSGTPEAPDTESGPTNPYAR
jgi:hypothetical protein